MDSASGKAEASRHAAANVAHALTLAPQNPEALLECGIIRQRNGDATGARADWNSAMKVAPGSAAAGLAQQNLALLDAGLRTGN